VGVLVGVEVDVCVGVGVAVLVAVEVDVATGVPVAVGVGVDVFVGVAAPAVTLISSIPMNSSLPAAFVVIMRTSRTD